MSSFDRNQKRMKRKRMKRKTTAKKKMTMMAQTKATRSEWLQ